MELWNLLVLSSATNGVAKLEAVEPTPEVIKAHSAYLNELVAKRGYELMSPPSYEARREMAWVRLPEKWIYQYAYFCRDGDKWHPCEVEENGVVQVLEMTA